MSNVWILVVSVVLGWAITGGPWILVDTITTIRRTRALEARLAEPTSSHTD